MESYYFQVYVVSSDVHFRYSDDAFMWTAVKAVFTRATFCLFVARHRDWRRRPTHKPLSRRLSAEVEHVPILGKK